MICFDLVVFGRDISYVPRFDIGYKAASILEVLSALIALSNTSNFLSEANSIPFPFILISGRKSIDVYGLNSIRWVLEV